MTRVKTNPVQSNYQFLTLYEDDIFESSQVQTKTSAHSSRIF